MPYCPTKSDLERRMWNLVERFQVLASRLADLAGTNHQAAFAEAEADCAGTRTEIVELRRHLEAHQSEHKC